MTSTDRYEVGSAGQTAADERGAGHGAAGQGPQQIRRLTPADAQAVRFSRGTRVHPGYTDTEVDGFLRRVADELSRLTAEKAELRDEVLALRQEISGVTAPEPPSEQAVRMLAVAQQTADDYVAEAESFSRIATQQAREEYEEQLRQARDKAGAIIQAAQEAAESILADGGPAEGRPPSGLPEEELQEQVRYLKAFAQAVRVQLRAYLEALLTDVETEWGRADPSSLTRTALPGAAVRPGREAPRALTGDEPNVAATLPEHSSPHERGPQSAVRG